MHATIGDRIVVRAAHEGQASRDGEVVEVRGADGAPPYLVRWSDNGHTTLYFPAADSFIAPYEPAPVPSS
jgi:hypothetical protein